MNYKKIIILIAASALIYSGCGKSSSGKTYPRFKSGDNEILSFSFTSQKNSILGADVTGTISSDTIEITVPYGTDVKSLVAVYVTNSTDVSVNDVEQVNGETVNNFSSDVVYTVTAENGDVKTYTVKVTIAPSSEKIIKNFYLNGYEGSIDQSSGIISVTLPPNSSKKTLTATFDAVCKKILVGETVQTSSETSNDFENDVVYTVEAEDNSTRTYTVKVTVEKATTKEIESFKLSMDDNAGKLSGDASVEISQDGRTISALLPYGSAASGLVARFTTTGESVLVNNAVQVSGTTQNDYSSPVEFTVVAQDGSSQVYTVTVTVAKNSAKAMTTFALDGEAAVIDPDTGAITIEFPKIKDITALKAVFTSTGVKVSIDGTEQVSGETANNFTLNPVYRVTAEDGTYTDYTVTIRRSEDIAGIWNFSGTGGSDFTISGAQYVNLYSRDILQFDGWDDFVLIPDNDNLTLAKAGTIEVTLKVNAHKMYAGIVHKGVKPDFSDETFSLQYWETPGKLRFLVTNAGGQSSYIDCSTALELNRWYHIVATWDVDEGLIRIFIDGVKKAEGTITTGDCRDSDGAMVIGAQLPEQYPYHPSWGNLAFNGLIDRVQLMNRALSPSEVLEKYSNFNPETGLTAYIVKLVPANKPVILTVLLIIAAMMAGIYLKNRHKSTRE